MYTKRKQSPNSLLEKLEGSWDGVEVAGGDPGQGEKGTLTVTVPFFLNCNKQEAAAGAGSQKESYTLERSRELRNIFLRNKKEIKLPRNYLWYIWFFFFNKWARCSGGCSEQRIPGEGKIA